MSGWEPGDLALCVRTGEVVHHAPNGVRCHHEGRKVPPRGSVREVVRVEPALTDKGTVFSCGCLTLSFADGGSGVALRFINITPGAEAEGIEEPRRIPVKKVSEQA